MNKEQPPIAIPLPESLGRFEYDLEKGTSKFIRNEAEQTVGKILKEAIGLKKLTPSVVENVIGLPKGMLTDLMKDEFYTNSVPVVFFKNLLVSLHIPFRKIEPAMLPTFRVILAKETPASIKKKPHGYGLWENEESVIKYTNHLKEIMQPPEQTPNPQEDQPLPPSQQLYYYWPQEWIDKIISYCRENKISPPELLKMAQTNKPQEGPDSIYKRALEEIIHTTASKAYTPFQKVDRCFGVAAAALGKPQEDKPERLLNPIIVFDVMNKWVNDRDRESIPRKAFLEIAKEIVADIKNNQP